MSQIWHSVIYNQQSKTYSLKCEDHKNMNSLNIVTYIANWITTEEFTYTLEDLFQIVVKLYQFHSVSKYLKRLGIFEIILATKYIIT